MNLQRTTLEIIAPSVEEAIRKGLADLALPAEAVDVEILDEGSRGLFGIGARQARVRLLVKTSDAERSDDAGSVPKTPAEMGASLSVPVTPAAETVAPQYAAVSPGEPTLSPEDEQALRVAQDTVAELLAKMRIQAKVTAHYGQAEEPKNRPPLLVDIEGDDLSILIGKRSETLNALQYIATLIISKELGHSVPLLIDIQGYRARRSMQVRQIARRVAEQVVKTGRRQALEPMPANERRLVHMELRNHPDVYTESTGEEPYRKVNILPKK